MEREFLTVTEVAERLRTTTTALYTQRHRGQLPGALAIKLGGRLVFRASELESYLQEREDERAGVSS